MTELLPFRYSTAAAEDVRIAYRWLEQIRSGLGREFVYELDRLGNQIRRYPEMYERVRGDCRRAVLKKFDYAMAYRIRPYGIEVVGVLHCRLDPAIAAARAAS